MNWKELQLKMTTKVSLLLILSIYSTRSKDVKNQFQKSDASVF